MTHDHVVVVDETPSNQAEGVLALRQAQNADPSNAVFYHLRYHMGWVIVRVGHPSDAPTEESP